MSRARPILPSAFLLATLCAAPRFCAAADKPAPAAAAADQRSHYAAGEEHFFAGRVREALVEWDAQVKEDPASLPGHWQRGIALYYAGRYADGRAQFEAHQKVNSEDVENAVWHFLCVAKLEGVEAARRVFIPIADDARVPMKQVHALFAGKGTAEDVEKAAAAAAVPGSSAAAQRRHECYAQLYLGLYREACAEPEKAKQHMLAAAALAADANYMGRVAVLHCRLRGWDKGK